jgi:murein L,D-transpeptidase YafK
MFWIFMIIALGFAAYFVYPGQKLPEGSIIDKIEVYKSKRRMHVFSDGVLLKTYTISLGRNPIGHKELEGDCKTPEGIYTINARNPHSGYHKNLGISYPNADDLENARKLGKPAGGAIKIHGLRNGSGMISKLHRWKDWTAGCIAVTNSEIDELYKAVEPNAEIRIFP